MNALGRHLLLELNDCNYSLLNNIDLIRETLIAAANASGATILDESFHRFSPQGISGVVIIAESHLSIHTWPEYGYAGADIFTCGTTVQPEKAAEIIIERLHPETHSIVLMHRGMVDIKQGVAKS